MKPVILGIILLTVTVGTFLYTMRSTPKKAHMLLIHGVVHTLDEANPLAEAIAISGTRILAVGKSDDLLAAYQSDIVLDLEGKTVVPGLIEGHAHVRGLVQLMSEINLFDISSPESILALVRKKVSVSPPGSWIQGRGWDQNLWPGKSFPTAAMLDKVAPANPVVLVRVDGHASWVNHKAMELAGVAASTPDPAGGKMVRDPAGSPTGIFMEDAGRNLVERMLPPIPRAEKEEFVVRALGECARLGVTEVNEMGANEDDLAVFKKLADEQRLPVRLYVAIDATDSAWQTWSRRPPLIGYGNGMLTVRSVKMYFDGALGSRGAALFEEYADDPGNRGITTMNDAEVDAIIEAAVRKGYQPCIHAIGDRANHLALNAFERMRNSHPGIDIRPRIEHAQVLDPKDIGRFRILGVLPSMQPIHATSDMPWAEARLGPDRVKGAYAWRSILSTGTAIISGSDFPNDNMNPFRGFHAAVTRTDRAGLPAGGWYPDQCMTRGEALRSYTTWAARGSFEELIKGTIEPGKLADLTVLTKDVLRVPAQELLTTESAMTIVGGRIVYRMTQGDEIP